VPIFVFALVLVSVVTAFTDFINVLFLIFSSLFYFLVSVVVSVFDRLDVR